MSAIAMAVVASMSMVSRSRATGMGEETIANFIPRPYHTASPGYVYGGLIASLIDCHGTGTAAAAAYRAEGRSMDTNPALRYVTASLKVDYLKPTPLGVPLEIRGRIKEIKGAEGSDGNHGQGRGKVVRPRGSCGSTNA